MHGILVVRGEAANSTIFRTLREVKTPRVQVEILHGLGWDGLDSELGNDVLFHTVVGEEVIHSLRCLVATLSKCLGFLLIQNIKK